MKKVPSNTGTPDGRAETLNPKPHFVILDGLRGVAALGVVVFHFMEWIYSDSSKNFIGHGFLAVDFFFCLSGFVIGYAYDDRIDQMSVVKFFTSRLIRLHPLVVLGSVLGLLAFLFDPFASQSAAYSTGKLILLFLCSALLIPLPLMKERSFNLFGLNAPSWSLFWEYMANVVYALILYKLNRRYLTLLTVLTAVLVCLVSYRAGNLLGGWAGANFWDGGARVAYSFSAGLLIYRSNWMIKNRLGFSGLTLLLLLAFVMPYFTWNWLAEALVVLFYFPLLVSLGAGSRLPSRLTGLCILLGKLSYPLYMTHYSVIWMFANYYTSHKLQPNELSIIVLISVLILVGIAYVAMVGYDTPIRRYLNRQQQHH